VDTFVILGVQIAFYYSVSLNFLNGHLQGLPMLTGGAQKKSFVDDQTAIFTGLMFVMMINQQYEFIHLDVHGD